jgi:hypothetical protein
MKAVSNAAVVLHPLAPVGIRHGLAQLAHASHGDWLLSTTAFGLIFAAFDLLQARFHEA